MQQDQSAGLLNSYFLGFGAGFLGFHVGRGLRGFSNPFIFFAGWLNGCCSLFGLITGGCVVTSGAFAGSNSGRGALNTFGFMFSFEG